MAYVIGIDTGGTYTDAVLLNTSTYGTNSVERKSKAFTTHDELELGIKNSIAGLALTLLEIEKIEKVVLSTTLATNAIVEGKINKIGLILIGGKPIGDIATEYVKEVSGSINIKGRILLDIDEDETRNAIDDLIPGVESIAVSGLASVRNPILEQKVKAIIHSMCDMPVMCGHELVSDLGFLERTNTVVLNVGLLPTINSFIKAIKSVLIQLYIKAPVFVVKGDGSIAKIDAIQNTPIDTVLSGPVASMIGAINLTEINDAVVVDMGGTTTDTGIVRKKRVQMLQDGAMIGNWKIRIKSPKLYTFGLGGDSQIKIRNGEVEIGPERVLPACRGGKDVVTPTDILHYTGEFVKWSIEKAILSVEKHAAIAGISPSVYVSKVKDAITNKIDDNMVEYKCLSLPICAIGAPAESWYHIVKEKYGLNLIIPKHYEVANAVGAATASIQVEVEAIVRLGEDGYGYIAHTKIGRYMFIRKGDAVNKAVEVSKKCAVDMITEQDLELAHITYSCEEMYDNGSQLIHYQLNINDGEQTNSEMKDSLGTYLGTRIKVIASGKIFAN